MSDDPQTRDATKPVNTTGTTRIRLRDFSRSLPMALLRARESVMRHFRPSLRAFDLTEQQWRVLRAVSSVPECEITQIARATHLLGPSLSRILRDLDERQLIVRRTSDEDMRFGLVSISPLGVDLMRTVAAHSERIYAEITRTFGEAKLASLMESLNDLEAALGAGDPVISGVTEEERERFIGNARKRGRPRKDAEE